MTFVFTGDRLVQCVLYSACPGQWEKVGESGSGTISMNTRAHNADQRHCYIKHYNEWNNNTALSHCRHMYHR